MAHLRDLIHQILSHWVEEKSKPFKNSRLGAVIRDDLKRAVELVIQSNSDKFIVSSSAGKGNWANVPWLAIFHKDITKSTRKGVYPVYLFKSDGSGVYLSLNQGVTDLEERLGRREAKIEGNRIGNAILKDIPLLRDWNNDRISLMAQTNLAKSYEHANIAAKYYSIDSLPSNEVLEQDLFELLAYYEIYAEPKTQPENRHLNSFIKTKNSTESSAFSPISNLGATTMKSSQLTPLPKPFILLAGISGTGKTRFVKQQAAQFGDLSRNFCLIPVRPDWHEPSEILGYWSRLNASTEREYVATKTLGFLVKAWADIVESVGLNGVNFDEVKNAVVVEGAKKDVKSALPFWLCFDEMNLAPVEQYLADYLSVLEMRGWEDIGNGLVYESPTLLDAEVFSTGDTRKLRAELGLQDNKYDAVWQLLSEIGLALPYNLIVAGTVNMDETTHQFSRKVLDRAISIDFEAFYPVDFSSVFSPLSKPVTFTYPTVSHITSADQLSTVAADSEGQLTTQFIVAINEVLDGTVFKLAYRTFNELLTSLHGFNPQTKEELAAVWDDFVMYKVLPRLEGDVDKLSTSDGGDLLVQLKSVLAEQFDRLKVKGLRADLFSDSPDAVALRYYGKLEDMSSRLERSGAVSFWL